MRRSRIACLDKYQGPPTVEVAGQPVEGRSGGGLFSGEGYVIGVCNAADPSDKEGLFAALPSIYSELDQDKLAFVYKLPGDSLAAARAETGAAPAASPPPTAMPGPTSVPAELAALGSPPPLAAEAAPGLPSEQQAALDEMRRWRKQGADVVCIIRPRGNPDAECQVIMLKGTSEEFVRQLASEGRTLGGSSGRLCPPTSLEVTNRAHQPTASELPTRAA